MAVSEHFLSPLDLRGAVQLHGEEGYLAERSGSTECLHFSTAHLEIKLEHQVLAARQ